MDADGRWRILRLHVEDQVPLAALARHHGLGVRTLERWHARYRAGGLSALGRVPRADAGGHHLPADLIALIEGWIAPGLAEGGLCRLGGCRGGGDVSVVGFLVLGGWDVSAVAVQA